MDVHEAIERAQEKYRLENQSKPFRLKNGMTPADIPADADRLTICYDYQGKFPDLGRLPQLHSLTCACQLSSAQLEQMDLSRLERLSVDLSECPGDLCINAPGLRDLSVCFVPRESEQLTFSDLTSYTVDLRELSALQRLAVRYCKSPCILELTHMPELTRLSFYDSECALDRLPELAPNLHDLVLCKCGLRDISFIKQFTHLTRLDLSYNQIQDVTCLGKLQDLTEVSLYKNPVSPEAANRTKCSRIIVTEQDKLIHDFLDSLELEGYAAYFRLLNMRNPGQKRSAVMQRIIDDRSDEDIYAHVFAEKIESTVDRKYNRDARYRNNKLGPEELKELSIQKYPFLSGLL